MENQVKFIKHEFRNGIFVRGHENDPKSPNILNYTLSCSKKLRWKEGQILHNFVNICGGHIMYHSSIKVGKILKNNGVWIGTKGQIDSFLNKVPLTSKKEPIDNGPFIFDGEFIETDEWNHGEMVEWARTKNGKIPRGWVSLKSPKKISTQRFQMYEKPTDLVNVPYSEIKEFSKDKKMIDMLSRSGLYRITDGPNKKETKNDYIGSAGSEGGGIFKRFTDYISNGHGGNKKLIEEHKKNSNFLESCYFTVLSVFPDDYKLRHIQKAESDMKENFECTWN